uniref:Solute carrier family 52, riboflavin transporter, member 3 n=1 Tax=Osmerus mordax TaxID=8014 RepID=S52A3_OSMMO|nr:RecName: Full=Solute carrier family 52, riboflavin transporter, member 3; AltName: Full=Riboflavin transporter 2; Short=RFT2 [Osmerus mordax]ACO09700.1 C20orf54 homolog precursor [Osmerus mordax]
MAILIYALACAFGLGSWLAINGLWVELPIIVTTLPEGWELPSYLTVIIQLANLGPLLVTLMHKLCPGRLKESVVIYTILCIGVLACFLLAFFLGRDNCGGWGPAQRSLLHHYFLPGTSGLHLLSHLPALHDAAACPLHHHTEGGDTYVLQTQYLPPNFTTEVFFFFLAVMMCISLAAFWKLNRLPRTFEVSTENLVPDSVSSVCSGLDNPAVRTNSQKHLCEVTSQARPLLTKSGHSMFQLTFIYLMVVWVNGTTNGLLPSVQTYSCMPYGNLAYHLSAALASVANPVACIVAMFFPKRSLVFLGLLCVMGTGFASYNMAMAAMSPCPLLQKSALGEAIIVLSWVFFTGSLSYVKVMVGVILRDESHSALVWCGAAAQIGSLIGSVIMFPLINMYNLFQSGDTCSTKCPL